MNELELKQEVSPVVSVAGEFIVTNPDNYTNASEFLKEIKGAQKKVVEFFDPMKKKAHEAWKSICDREGEFLNPLKTAESSLKTKMLAFQRHEEEKRLAEQRHLQAIADEKARKERERLIKEAEKLKTPELKEQRLAEAETFVAPAIEVQSEVPEVKGISFRKTWKAELVSKEEFVKAAAVNPMLMTFVEIDMAKLNRIAAATKGEVVYPGVRIFEESNIASGSN
jgi:hypothetical protein